MPAYIHSRKKDIAPPGSALAKLVAGRVVLLTVLLVASLLLSSLPTPAFASTGGVKLDPMNPTATFQIDGQPAFLAPATRAGDPLAIADGSTSDFCGLYAASNDAAGAAELAVTFSLTPIQSAFAEAGARFVINDGQRSAVIAACIIKGGQRGIGLATNGAFTDENTYPVFVPVDWTVQTTLKLRRTAGGDAQLVELNGTPLNPPPTLASIDVRGPIRPGPSFEFGAFGVEATATANFWSVEGRALSTVADLVTVDASVSGGHGTVNPSSQTVNYNDSATMNISPDTGYHIAGITDNGAPVTIANPYVISNVIATHTVVVTFGGPRSSKQDVLDGLTALRATVTDKQDGNKLDEAIKHLTKSLKSSWWNDDAHLQVKEGEKVFNEEKDAVNKLRDLIKDKKSSISDATLQGFVDRIVEADRVLAVVAIADATGGDPKDLAKANEELGKGSADAALGKYESAIEHYRNAWKFSVSSPLV